jgi:ubiquinone/menaquinone biosynthesis C-methylase UbiE
MNAPKDQEVLDAGCGPGVHSIRAARLGHKVHAIDISSTMLEHARQRVAASGLREKVRFSQMDLTNLMLDSGSISHAFSWGVIIHIPKAELAFAELARVMRPGGRLGLYLTNQSAFDHKLEKLARALTGKKLRTETSSLGEGVRYTMDGEELWVWQFNAALLRRYMEQLGFRLVWRRAGEFSEIQRRTGGALRNALLHANNLAYRLNAPASLAVSNMYVFERI